MKIIIHLLKNGSPPAFEPITLDEGGVEVTVRPIDLSDSSPNWSFEVSLSTHSVKLSEDMVSVSKLVLDSGETLSPSSWERDPPGGHHRSGILKFQSTAYRPKSIEIKIASVAGVLEREFRWSLN